MRTLPDAELLLTLLAVAEAGSESDASVVLGIGQSSVSRRLAALQQDAKEPLTQRTAAGLKLTSAGERLLPHARRLRGALLAAGRTLGADSRPLDLRLALSSHLASRLAGALVRAGRQGSTQTLSLVEGSSRDLLRRVQDGTLPAAVTLWAPAGAEPGFTAERIASDRLTCVAVSGNPVVRGGELRLADAHDQTFLVPAEDSVVTARAVALLRRHGMTGAAMVSVGGAAAVRAAALAGAGVGVTLASVCAADVAAGWLAAAPFPLPDGAMDVWLLLSDALEASDAVTLRALVAGAVAATAAA